MSIHTEEMVQYQDGFVPVSVKRRVATLMPRVARTKAILSCLGLECKLYAIKMIAKVRLHKRGTRGVDQGHGVSPGLIMRLDKEPVRFSTMGIGTRRSGENAKKERNRRGLRECPKAKEIRPIEKYVESFASKAIVLFGRPDHMQKFDRVM